MFSRVRRRCWDTCKKLIFSTAIFRIWRVILQLLRVQAPQVPQDVEHPTSRYIDFTPRTYEDYSTERGTEPHTRFLRLVYHFSHLKWHLKVTFEGKLQQTSTFAQKSKRRGDLLALCLCIDMDLIQPQLLNDTVTELRITCQQDAAIAQTQLLPLKTALDKQNEYVSVINNLVFCIREDPCRVRFPIYNGGSIPTRALSEISKTEELSTGVYKARIRNEEASYIYKEVDRPMYEPRDSEVLEQELRNLTVLHGKEGVLQLVAPVVSRNPYQTAETTKDDCQTVLRGILTEYHPKGTLQSALQSSKRDLPWHRWAVQITEALYRLHQLCITHMDLKPANIVLSEDLDAILIDLSGIGGTTREWLSPEMGSLSDPLSEDRESRMQNDVWALGKILSAMADIICDGVEKQMLLRVSAHATTDVPQRISLREALRYLTTFPLQNSVQSTSLGSNPPSERLAM